MSGGGGWQAWVVRVMALAMLGFRSFVDILALGVVRVDGWCGWTGVRVWFSGHSVGFLCAHECCLGGAGGTRPWCGRIFLTVTLMSCCGVGHGAARLAHERESLAGKLVGCIPGGGLVPLGGDQYRRPTPRHTRLAVTTPGTARPVTAIPRHTHTPNASPAVTVPDATGLFAG